jgi:hypothetical protein
VAVAVEAAVAAAAVAEVAEVAEVVEVVEVAESAGAVVVWDGASAAAVCRGALAASARSDYQSTLKLSIMAGFDKVDPGHACVRG